MKTTKTHARTPFGRLMRAFSTGSAVLMAVAGVALISMVLVVSADVALRNLFGVAVTGVAEVVAQWLMPTTILFALAYAEHRSEHIRVTVVQEGMQGPPRLAVAVMGQVFAVAIAVIMAIGSIELAMHSMGIRETVPMGTGQLAIWPIKAAIVPAWIWLALQSAAVLLGTLFPWLGESARSNAAALSGKVIGDGISA